MGRTDPARVPGTIRRAVCLLALAAVLSSACGGREQAIYEVPPGGLDAPSTLPKVVDSVPAFVVRADKSLHSRQIETLEDTSGAALVSPVSIQRLKVEGPEGTEKLTVAAVDPISFRNVAPLATRDADFVWASLLAGDVILTDAAAKKLGIKTSGQVRFGGGNWKRVGAFADNGTPNLADVMIAAPRAHVARSASVAVVGVKSGTTLEGVAKSLERRVPKARVRWLIPKREIVASAPKVQQTATVSGPTIAGLNPTLSASVNKLVAASGGRVWIVSGYRTSLRQYQLWTAALQKYGSPEAADNWVAPPGHSMHERGLAVDLGGDLNYAAQLVQQLGLPMWRPMSWEPWHFELTGSRG